MLQAPGQVVEDQLAPGIDQLQPFVLQPAIEQRQVTAIGSAGIVGKAFLQPQGIEELVYQRVFDGGHGHSNHTVLKLRTKLKMDMETAASLS
ncbi:hypothetical protein D3C76_1250190 [compost metagenome]